MSTFTIREATEDDAERLHQFMTGLVSEQLPVLYERKAPPTTDEERGFVRGTRETGGVVLVAVSNDRIVGLLDFHRDGRAQASHGGQFGMSVAGDHRRQGVGRALLEALITWARSNSVTRIELQVFETNVPAIHLYEQMGFQIEGRRRQALVVAGRTIDVLIMARISSIDVPKPPHRTTG